MRLLVPVEHLGPTDGVAVQTFQTCRALAERGHEIDVCYLNGGEYEPAYSNLCRTLQKVPVLGFPLRRPHEAVHALAVGARLGRRLHPDVVYDNLGWTLAAMAAAARGAGAPIVSHVHGFGPGEQLMRSTRLLLPRSRRIITVSRYCQEQLPSHGVPASAATVVHNGIDASAYPQGGLAERQRARAELGLDPASYVVLFYGRIHPTKGVDVLVDAVGRLAPDLDVEVVVMGTTTDDQYADSCRRRAARLRFHWLDAHDDVVTPLHAADVVVVPSTWNEPFGRVVIEALATGRPVVASRIGGLPEILDGRFGDLLVEAGDPLALAATIRSLWNWRDKRPELADQCRSLVVEHFSLVAMIDRIEAELHDACL